MNDRRSLVCSTQGFAGSRTLIVLAATALALAAPAAGAAAPARKAVISPAAHVETGPAQSLAKAIEASLQRPGPVSANCPSTTRIALRQAVEGAVEQSAASREVAAAALKIVRDQSPPGDACRLAALDDSATELSGNGELVDDGEAVRGFVLYTGSMPATAR